MARARKQTAFEVRELRREARRMITIEAGKHGAFIGDVAAISGALVRVRSGCWSAEDLDGLAATLREKGAAEVKVLPPERAAPEIAPDAERSSRLYSGPREAVLALCAEAVGIDQDALAAICGEIMDGEGM